MGLLASVVGIFANIAQVILLVLGMFLILVVLLQRGRGGGLAGAFGGAGGQSAFGTKAGDVFTKITIGIAILWVITNGVNGMLIRASQSALSSSQFASGEDDDGPQVSPGDGENDVPLAPEAGSGASGGAAEGEGEESEDTGEDTAAGEAAETSEATTSDEASPSNEGEAPADPDTSEDAAVEEGAADGESAETPDTETTPESTTAPEATEATPEAGATTDGAANPPN